jgi:hypothetical protein
MLKRQLTPIEIEEILDFIKPNPNIPIESAISIVNTNKNKLKTQLLQQQIYPQQIPKLKAEIEKLYFKSHAEPGLSVGILCAQSIGERQTQLTLNTFHKTG